MRQEVFDFADERFADVQMLRYRLNGFENLSTQQKQLIYYLSQATLCGRDIITDQFGKYNLRIRKSCEALYIYYKGTRDNEEFCAFETYLKRVWFSNGIYHHYGCEKFTPQFSESFFKKAILSIPQSSLPLKDNETVEELCDEIFPVIFDPNVLPKRVNKADGEDLILTSACNFYQGVNQQEVEDYYASIINPEDKEPISYGLNSTLVKDNGEIKEITWKENGLYGSAIHHILYWLGKAMTVAENDQQRKVIQLLMEYYQTGDLRLFDQYSIEWLKELDGQIDFINGFIEVYGDPLGMKGSWEGLVEYKDIQATKRAQLISDHAQWFEDHSPIDPRFRKPVVKGVTANVICAAMLGGDEYPSTAIGINLPNADWIRAQYGSKSITISNITEAYDQAAKGNGFKEEFIDDERIRHLIEKFGDVCDNLHTDLHECLGHGSGQLLPGTDPNALKSYGNTIEEARADLFGLYYMADEKMVELGLLPDPKAYQAHYYTYILNGLMTQLTRINLGNQIEEAHMRNRALIARWVYEHSKGIVSLVRHNDKTYLRIYDYQVLRSLFAQLLAEIQRIKSEGDYDKARELVEKYAVKINRDLHEEIIARYKKLNIAPYKGFINPWLKPVIKNDEIVDIEIDYTESYSHQMLRYSTDFGFL
ncbi:MAG: dihydrofolate reductase [Prevotella sp.]|nr:dihydrofolate reductase [Prevotella sp.]